MFREDFSVKPVGVFPLWSLIRAVVSLHLIRECISSLPCSLSSTMVVHFLECRK